MELAEECVLGWALVLAEVIHIVSSFLPCVLLAPPNLKSCSSTNYLMLYCTSFLNPSLPLHRSNIGEFCIDTGAE
jgi:hypothetical protein